MALLPVTPPAGIVKNGTDYANKGRWVDGDLIRFENGFLKPIGGWSKLIATALDGEPIGMYAYADNTGESILAIGSCAFRLCSSVYKVLKSGLADVPPGLTPALSFINVFICSL